MNRQFPVDASEIGHLVRMEEDGGEGILEAVVAGRSLIDGVLVLAFIDGGCATKREDYWEWAPDVHNRGVYSDGTPHKKWKLVVLDEKGV